MSLATWTVTLAAAGLLIHAMNKKKAAASAEQNAGFAQPLLPAGEPADAYSTTDPVSGRVKPTPAMRSDDEVEPGLPDFVRGA